MRHQWDGRRLGLSVIFQLPKSQKTQCNNMNLESENFDKLCCRCGGNRYGVFTEVGKYLDWIGEQFDLLPPEKIY